MAGEHVSVLAEDRLQVDPALSAQAAGFLERRETFRADNQTFAGKVSAYELGPLHPAGLPRQLVPAGAQRGQGPGRELRPVAFSAHRGAGGPSTARRTSMPAPMRGRPSGSRAVRSP